MRIGIFSPVLRSGGTEKVIAKLSCVWTSLNHDVIFFTHSEPESIEFQYECLSRECKTDGEWDVEDAKKYQSKYNLDIIIFNGRWNERSTATLLRFFKAAGVVTMVILHHAMNNWAFSGANAGDFEKEDVFRNLDCLVCVDKIQALWWSRRFNNVFYIPNPVSIDLDLPLIDCKKNVHSLVWVGRADDWGKRVDVAITAFKLIKREISDATLSIIGLKPKDKLVGYSGLTYVGRVQDTRPYLKNAAVNLVSTLWEVTVPQVILEAGAMGVPTVAMDLPILRDTKESSSAIKGLLLAKNSEEMAKKTIELLRNDVERVALGNAARKDVEERANHRIVIEKWKDLFSAIKQKRIFDHADIGRGEYETIDVCRVLIDEIQRSESFVVKNQLPVFQRINLWKGRLNGLKRRLGL